VPEHSAKLRGSCLFIHRLHVVAVETKIFFGLANSPSAETPDSPPLPTCTSYSRQFFAGSFVSFSCSRASSSSLPFGLR
jgi:hypothetical protein